MAPPAKKAKSLKQGNLFSFFSRSVASSSAPSAKKKAAPAKPAVSSPPPTQKAGSKTPPAVSQTPTQTTTTPKASPPPPPPSTKQQQPWSKNTLWRKLKVGSRIGIYWKDDKCYYPCTIEKQATDGTTPSSRFFVRYDDGESEWTDMAVEKLRWLDDDEEEDDEDPEEVLPSRRKDNSHAMNSSKRKRIQEDSDDDEGENEFEDDGSVFEAGSEEEDDEEEFDAEEEEEEDNWMVTDDELEEETPQKKKKKKRAAPTKPKASQALRVTRHDTPPASTPPSKRARIGGDGSSSVTTTASTTTGSAFKTPLKDFAHTVSPNTSSSQKSKALSRTSRATTSSITATPPKPSSSAATSSADKKRNPALPEEPLPTNHEKGAVNVRGAHVHNHLKFLRYPKDAQGRPRDHPDYDPRTLKVNEHEWQSVAGSPMTAAVKQWWDLKSRYFDTILLFKTGKFYEMFHTDADVGVELLGFIYMKGKVAHSGFPEISYGPFADKLVRAGYKVARVEQTETPDMLKERKARTPRNQKKPKVVNREVCSVMTLGTRTFCALDEKSALLAAEGGAGSGGSETSCGPLLAIREEPVVAENDTDDDDDAVRPVCEYGITVVDAIRGTVTLGMFADDVLRNRLRTLLACFEPSEILLPSTATQELRSLVEGHRASSRSPCRLETIHAEESFPRSTALDAQHAKNLERGHGPHPTVRPWDPGETLAELHRRKYYPQSSKNSNSHKGISRWPAVLQMVVRGEASLCLSSFGAALYYLQRNLIDREILGMGIVRAYIPQESPALPERAPAASNSTNSGDSVDGASEGFWTKQQQQLEASHPAGANSASGGLEENPLYQIPTHTSAANSTTTDAFAAEDRTSHMALDGTTLHNLEILTNSVDFKTAGSLWSKLNHTKSPHGARMLRAWLLRPLFRKADIDRRADAVSGLAHGPGALALQELREVLAKVGDLDRLLSRIHSMSVGVATAPSGSGSYDEVGSGPSQAESHPNERAVLYEGPQYTKRKVTDFKNALKGLQKACQIPEIFADVDLDKSGLLHRLVRPARDQTGGYFPDMEESLEWFFENFDCDKAAAGQFVPGRGTDPVYDEACDTIHRVQEELEHYRQDLCQNVLKPRHVASRAWKYINTKPESKDKYLIELPVTVQVPDDFLVKAKRGSGAKQVNKYRTDYVAERVRELEQALEVQATRRAKGMQIVFAKFDAQRPLWASAAHITSLLDALGSLAVVAGSPGYCRAEIVECPSDGSVEPHIDIVQGRHPVVENTFHTSEFIPNDLALGTNPEAGESEDAARMLLLSGPNMGGKSTMLRQTCLIAILAQIGSYVPAESCRLTPIDCIFTRLGASDRILLGQSTFFVELAETAAALRGATRRSLVIMDELGRGTSTFDGTAIASATVKHLVERSKCLTLFATHYHSLLDEWKDAPNVRLGHMQCMVDEDEEEGSSNSSNITFLYTLGPGSCPKSFGINVAKLAGLPEEVLANAKRVSAEFEDEMNGKAGDDDNKITEETATELTNKLEAMISSGQYNNIVELWKDARMQCDIKD